MLWLMVSRRLNQIGPKVTMTSLALFLAIRLIVECGTRTLPKLSKMPRIGSPHAS